jgi:hypothetical protein
MRDRDQALELIEVAARELKALKGMSDAETFADEVLASLLNRPSRSPSKLGCASLKFNFR